MHVCVCVWGDRSQFGSRNGCPTVGRFGQTAIGPEDAERYERNSDLDSCLAGLCDRLFLDGEGAGAGLTLNAAVEASSLEYVRRGKFALPTFDKTSKGKQTMAPMHTRCVVPEPVAFVVCGLLLHTGKREMSLLSARSFGAYPRVSEASGLHVEDIVAPVKGCRVARRCQSIVLAPMERHMATEMRAYEERCPPGQPERELARRAAAGARKLKRNDEADESGGLSGFTPRQYLTEFRLCVAKLRG